MYSNRLSITVSAIIVFVCSCLLTGCGTSFHNVPYHVGIRKPKVMNSKGELAGHQYAKCDQEIYRIGSAYYAKVETLYYPLKTGKMRWNAWTGDHSLLLDTSEGPIKKEFWYCLLNEEESSELALPALPQDGTTLDSLLTENLASENAPVFIRKVTDHQVPQTWSSMVEEEYTLAHYALLPATAVIYVLVDLPCTIIGSIGALFAE